MLRDAISAAPVAAAVGAGIVLVTFGLYVATAARDIVFGDTPELTAVALTAGVAHPPGYPVFTLIGWVFGQLPVGPPPFRIALLSVVCDTLTVGVVYMAAFRFTRSVAAAAVAAVALASSPPFWAWSLVGEVFPLNNLLAATMLLLVALWHEHPERRALLVAAGLVGGLGVANQQTILLLGPAVLYVIWRRRKVLLRDLSLVRNAAIAFAAGLLPYLALIPLAARNPEFSWSDIRGVADLIGHVLRRDYGSTNLLVDPKFTGGSLVDRVVALVLEMDPLFLLLVAAGTVFAWRMRRWYATYLLIAFAVAGPDFVAYTNADISDETTRAVLERFFLMPYVAIAPLAGFAVLAAAEVAARMRLARRALELAVAGVAVAAALAIVSLNYGQIDQSNNQVARTFGEDVLATIRPGALFLARGDPVVFTLGYLQTIEHARPDVSVVDSRLLITPWYTRQLARLHPDIVFTDHQYGTDAAPFSRLLDANRTRPMMAIGDPPDPSSTDAYYFASHGLLFDIRQKTNIVTIDDNAADSDRILATYRPPKLDSLRGPFRTWERVTLIDYASGYYRIGRAYELAGDSLKTAQPARATELYATARRWFERALAVDPELIEAEQGLTQLPK